MAAEKPSSDARRKRLSAALKANIGRRKAQARALEGAAEPAPEAPAAAPDEDGCPN